MLRRNQLNVWRYFDIWLFAAVILLTAYGVLMIRSAISGEPNFVGYEVRQIQFALLGVFAMLIVAAIDYRILTTAHWYIYAAIIVLLVLVFFVGEVRNNVEGWIPLGPVSFQPAELGRVLLPITLGTFLARRLDQINRFSNTVITLVYMAIPVGLLYIQPDLGMSILYMVVWFGMILIAGLPLAHFLVLTVAGLGLSIVAYPQLQEYQRARILTFIDPEAVPEQAFNIRQALISIGSGGWFGKGYFNGTQSQLGFLRVQHTDFIFSMITEEMGFVFGSLVVLGLLGFILLRILRAASLTTDPAGRLICVGIATVLFFQTTVSVGMNLQLLPVTGLTLPFVSYGGSSLATLYFAIGVVQSVLMRHRRQSFG